MATDKVVIGQFLFQTSDQKIDDVPAPLSNILTPELFFPVLLSAGDISICDGNKVT